MPVYKNKKRNTWYCSFYYQDWTGKRKRKKKEGFSTKREAQAFEKNFIEKESGNPTMTFNALYELYKDDCQRHLKKSTMLSKFSVIESHILPYFQDLRINDILPSSIRNWQNEITSKGYSPSYCYCLYRNLSAILNFAVRYYGLPSNPASKTGSIGKREVHQAFWTLEEFQRFAITLTKPEHIMIFYMLFWTGCRIGEILALTWNDVSESDIRINKTVSRIHGKAYLRSPKTKESNRIVKLPSFINLMLDDYKRHTKYLGENVFHATNASIARLLARHAEKAGLKKIRLHDFRHSHASMLIQAGVPAIAIAERLGHKNVQTTLSVYSHLYRSTKDKVISVIESL
jgi:integrase